MGPDSVTTTTSSSLKIINLPKLLDKGENWSSYKERAVNGIIAKGLRRHLTGTAGSLVPLSDDELEDHEEKMDQYLQKEASLRENVGKACDHLRIEGRDDADGYAYEAAGNAVPRGR